MDFNRLDLSPHFFYLFLSFSFVATVEIFNPYINSNRNEEKKKYGKTSISTKSLALSFRLQMKLKWKFCNCIRELTFLR